MKLYGLTQCGTVQKARAWLDTGGHAYDFHDFKSQGVSREQLEVWLTQVPWERLCNRAGLTWRALPPERKEAVTGPEQAIELMLEKPSLIKRPVLEKDGQVELGFSEKRYAALFGV